MGVDAESRPWLARLARAGMLAPGLLYVLIGGLALALALGRAKGNPSRKGALSELAQHTWYVVRGLMYSVLCFTTVQVMTGSTGNSDTASQQGKTAEVLSWPGGRLIVGAFGLGVIAYGAGSVYRGVTKKFADDLKLGSLKASTRKWLCRGGIFGWVARGLVLGLIGVFLVKAAAEYDPKQSKGLDAALASLQHQPYGRFLLGVVALGLVSFGLFYGVRARYREV